MTTPIETTRRPDDRRRRRGALWLWPLALALLVLGIILLAARGCDDDDGGKSGSATTATTGSGNGGGGGGGGANGGGGSASGGAGILTSRGTSLLPFGTSAKAGRLARLAGRPVQAKGVRVVSVVGDEVFWVGAGNADRILVHLRTSGESGPTVRAGDRATFTGTLAKNAAGAVETYGVTESEGAGLLERQGVHIETSVSSLKLNKG